MALQAVQRLEETFLAHGIVDGGYPAVTQRPHPLDEVRCVGQHGFRAAVGLCNAGLGGRPDYANDLRPEGGGPLAEQGAGAPSRSVDQHSIAATHPIAAADQIPGGESLQHDRRSRLIGNRVGQPDQSLDRPVAALRTGPRRQPGIRHAIAATQALHAVTGLLDHARGLGADAGRQGQRIQPGPVIAIEVIEPDSRLPERDFPRCRWQQRHGFPPQDVGTAEFVDTDHVGYGGLHDASIIAPCQRRF